MCITTSSESAEHLRDCYATLSEEVQCRSFDLIGLVACAGAGTLGGKHNTSALASHGTCSLCDTGSALGSTKSTWHGKPSDEIFLTLLKLIEGKHVQVSARPRVAAMVALRRLIMHTENVSYLDLGNSYLGQWSLQSLRSSLRELRISAGFVDDLSKS